MPSPGTGRRTGSGPVPSEDIPTLSHALSAWARATPDATALLSPGREPTTWRQLHDAVAHLAARLRALDLGTGDGIALLFPEGPDYCLALLAALSVGVAIPLTWPSPHEEYQQLLASGRVRAVLGAADMAWADLGLAEAGVSSLAMAADTSGRLQPVHAVTPRRRDRAPTLAPLPDNTALILRSSGTTGRPKLVPVTHRGIVSACRVMIATRGITPADRCMGLVKGTYSQGFHALAIPIVAGAAFISIPGLDFDRLPNWLRAFEPTYLSTTPAILRLLATEREAVQSALRDAPLRCFNCTAGSMAAGEIDALQSRFDAPILNLYGMTEATAIACESLTGFTRVPGSVGVPWCDLRIVDAALQPLPPTEVGEILVRGPRVVAGYLDDAEATAAAFLPGGWFRTGDIGRLDQDGYLHLTGRLGEVINRGGEKIAPREVDEAFLGHPAVADAAVFAVTDERLGEDIVAAVVLRKDMTVSPRGLRTWLRTRLAQFKVPRRIWLVDELPRTPTGKVQRGELARRWVEEQGL